MKVVVHGEQTGKIAWWWCAPSGGGWEDMSIPPRGSQTFVEEVLKCQSTELFSSEGHLALYHFCVLNEARRHVSLSLWDTISMSFRFLSVLGE